MSIHNGTWPLYGSCPSWNYNIELYSLTYKAKVKCTKHKHTTDVQKQSIHTNVHVCVHMHPQSLHAHLCNDTLICFETERTIWLPTCILNRHSIISTSLGHTHTIPSYIAHVSSHENNIIWDDIIACWNTATDAMSFAAYQNDQYPSINVRIVRVCIYIYIQRGTQLTEIGFCTYDRMCCWTIHAKHSHVFACVSDPTQSRLQV